MIARYLNLPHREDRRGHAEGELRRGGFTPKRIEGVLVNNPKGVGCSLGHLWLLADAFACGDELIFVFEDDFRWLRLGLLPAVIEFFRSEESLDGLLLAGWNVAFHPQPDERSGTVRIHGASTTQAYVLRRSAAAKLMMTYGVSVARAFSGQWGYHDYAIDVLWSIPMQRGHWRLCTPCIVGGTDSFSDIEGHATDHSWIGR